MSRNTVAHINMAALAHNLAVVRGMVGDCQLVSVIKADGYGHGISRAARALADSDVFAVATPGEAQEVRASGWQGRLLLLEGCQASDDLELAKKLKLEIVVHEPGQIAALRQDPDVATLKLWLKFDTGMHRLGFPLSDLAGVLEAARCSKQPPVLMTHFACADDAENSMTLDQIAKWDHAVAGIPLEQSLCNSAGILNFPHACRDYVRPGIMLYGISPLPGSTGADLGLIPAMTLSCELIAINQCRAGDQVGYSAAYTCPRDMRIGVAAIGYGDGYPRHLENGTPVLLNGRRALLAGRVSMDMISLDLSGHDDARVGDQVVLWGPDLPVESIAAQSGCIPYELICGVTRRVERLET